MSDAIDEALRSQAGCITGTRSQWKKDDVDEFASKNVAVGVGNDEGTSPKLKATQDVENVTNMKEGTKKEAK